MKEACRDLWAHRTECYSDGCSRTEGFSHAEQSDAGLNPDANHLLKNSGDYTILLAYRKPVNKAATVSASNLQPRNNRSVELK